MNTQIFQSLLLFMVTLPHTSLKVDTEAGPYAMVKALYAKLFTDISYLLVTG